MSGVVVPDSLVLLSGVPLGVDIASRVFLEKADLKPHIAVWVKADSERKYMAERVAEKERAVEVAEALSADNPLREVHIEDAVLELEAMKFSLAMRDEGLGAVVIGFWEMWECWNEENQAIIEDAYLRALDGDKEEREVAEDVASKQCERKGTSKAVRSGWKTMGRCLCWVLLGNKVQGDVREQSCHSCKVHRVVCFDLKIRSKALGCAFCAFMHSKCVPGGLSTKDIPALEVLGQMQESTVDRAARLEETGEECLRVIRETAESVARQEQMLGAIAAMLRVGGPTEETMRGDDEE